MRKFYINDFNQRTDYISTKRKHSSKYYIQCLRSYILDREVQDCLPPQKDHATISCDTLIFFLGSLIYPKDMIKSQMDEVHEDVSRNMRGACQDKPPQALRIIKIYHYLYRFSLERLHNFVKIPQLVILFIFYF